jgi:NAD-dependent deacetylase
MIIDSKKCAEIIRESNNIVFFGGAGVSTESGIPDFRSKSGLYTNNRQKYSPEEILSHSFFYNNTKYFFDFYRKNLINDKAKPNITHKVLSSMEITGQVNAIITQNIDGLHQLAGSKNVIELHGSINHNLCIKCGKDYSAKYVKESVGIPMCKECNSIIKPEVTLYEEPLNQEKLLKAIHYISHSKTLIIGGTSLVVYPAASLINYFSGDNLIIINKQATQYDYVANYTCCCYLSEVFSVI